MNHAFIKQEPVCEQCGMEELDHYWGCEEHNTAGNGVFNCPKCT